jgi:hypothetical protein
MLVFEGGHSLATPSPPPPSKTSHVGSFSRAVTPWQQHLHLHPRKRATYARFRGRSLPGNTISTSTLKNEPTWLVFESGRRSPVTPWQHHLHLHLHPRKRATYTRFRGRSLPGNTTSTSTLENEPCMLIFEGGCSLATPPPSPPSKTSLRACFRWYFYFIRHVYINN